jgi:pilus assembly protein CpaF
MVVGKDKIFIEHAGRLEDSGFRFITDDSVLAVIERIVAPLGRRIDKSTPLVDARLPDGSRVNAVIPPLSLVGPTITIRKFARVPLKMEDLVTKHALSDRMAKFLRACVAGKKNVVVSGGTGSGKTTMLNVLSTNIGDKERVVTIEDAAELQLQQSHVVSLETKPANVEGAGAYTIRDLVKNALRMRPDRIIVGECRGAEALDMLQAMNTGHSGSMTTAHANSPKELVSRIETMVLMAVDMPISAIRPQIVAAVDVVAQLQRFTDGRRRVTTVSEVVGIDPDTGEVVLEDIFVYAPTATNPERFIHTGYVPGFVDELVAKNILSLEEFF